MPTDPVPSLDFSAEQLIGIELVGTVPLPGPYPATGEILVVRYPASENPKEKDPRPKFFIKIIQKLSHTHTITRIVPTSQVRMIRFDNPDGEAGGVDPACETGMPRGVLVSGAEVQDAIGELKWMVKDEKAAYESYLPQGKCGVVYVPENAPVLTRHESLVTAATSLESIYPVEAHCPKPVRGFACPHGGGK